MLHVLSILQTQLTLVLPAHGGEVDPGGGPCVPHHGGVVGLAEVRAAARRGGRGRRAVCGGW